MATRLAQGTARIVVVVVVIIVTVTAAVAIAGLLLLVTYYGGCRQRGVVAVQMQRWKVRRVARVLGLTSVGREKEPEISWNGQQIRMKLAVRMQRVSVFVYFCYCEASLLRCR